MEIKNITIVVNTSEYIQKTPKKYAHKKLQSNKPPNISFLQRAKYFRQHTQIYV